MMTHNHYKDHKLSIPPTIESCNGSLHSEDHDIDNTEGNLFSETPDSDGGGNLSPITKEDKEFDKKWRGFIVLILLGNALIITASTYGFLANQEQKDFEANFERYAEAIIDACHYHASSVAVTFDSVSDAITSYARDSNSEWPQVTITDFELRSSHAREASFTELVGFVPLIANQRRMEQWETYSQENLWWLDESKATAAKFGTDETNNIPNSPSTTSGSTSTASSDTTTPATTAPPSTTPATSTAVSSANDGNSRHLQQQQQDQQNDNNTKRGPFAPIWQLSPPPVNEAIIGYDLLTHDILNKLLFAMYESQHTAISQVFDVSFLTAWEGPSKAQQSVNAELTNTTTPKSVIFQPIYEQHNFHDDNPELPVPRLEGVYFGILNWESYFSELLPEGINGIYCVIRNDCGQEFTFEINGREAVYLGMGEHHEKKYDANEISTTFYEFQKKDGMASVNGTTTGGTNATTVNANKDRFQCHYSLSIYPSSTLQAQQESSRPFFFTMIVGLIFVATAVVFFIYLKIIQSRTRKVEKVAKASNKIITSLFPEDVKNELMRDAQAEEKAMSMARTSNGKHQASSLVHEFLAGGDEESAMLTATRDTGSNDSASAIIPRFKSKPIANLFTDTTIFFADIAGFTKWSSTRTPTEVFELLEAIYGCFDELAKKRSVYKVETIGDCYVAVCGLPKPNKRHALVMTRFAQDCLNNITKVTKALEGTLGEDTSQLTMRIGLHSGPVTAGVLRGERSRFQLFGDTVNTASRMESNGRPRCIHVSEATAELLRGHGRSAWLRKREDLVDAKGKGKMQTYWVNASKGAMSYAETEMSFTSSSEERTVLSKQGAPGGIGIGSGSGHSSVASGHGCKEGTSLDIGPAAESWQGDEDVSASSDSDDDILNFGKPSVDPSKK